MKVLDAVMLAAKEMAPTKGCQDLGAPGTQRIFNEQGELAQ
jgi:hypothetical protein